MCMWMLQPVGVSSNHILRNSCFLALFSGPECAHWQHCLGYGLRAFGSGNCGYLECCPEVGREEWALIRQHNLAPHTLCPLGRGKSELGTLKWESPDSCPSYPSQRTKLMRKSLTHSNLGQRHTPQKNWESKPWRYIWRRSAGVSRNGKCKNPEVGACLVCSRSIKETRVTEVAQVEERWIERGDFIPRDQILRSLMGHYSSFDFYFVWHGKPWTAFECHFSHVWLFVTPWTVSFQATLSIGFSRQEYWNGLLASSPGDLPNPGTEPSSLLSPALAGEFFTTSGTSSIGYCLTN